jgi:hypothetical protein
MPIQLPFATAQLSLQRFGCEIFFISLTCLGTWTKNRRCPEKHAATFARASALNVVHLPALCGEALRKIDPHIMNDHFLSWCCPDGRLLTLWMLLWGKTSSGVSRVRYARDPYYEKLDPWWV